MRKIIIGSSFLLLAFFVIFGLSFAQELSIKEATESSDFIEEQVKYDLPYPGLLPDSPIYFLKALRDAVVEFLISDPLKKADFYLLQADKRINAGFYLVQRKQKYALAESTISKAQNYFEKSIGKAQDAKNEGMNVNIIRGNLMLASRKYQEIISGVMKDAPSETKGSFMNFLKRTEKLSKQAGLIDQ